MKKSTVLLLMLGIGIITSKTTSAQSTINPKGEKCLAEIMFQEAAAKDPSLILQRAAVDKFAAEYVQKQKFQKKSSVSPRIIPVVFHIIHECGAENISRAQCLDQIRILNLDYKRLNSDTTNTPPHFDSLAANCNIEFRLAKIDPAGNPTEGINRVNSSLTNNARDNVKALSYWDSKKYLNIWVVKTISGATPPLYVAGFAQFPGSGSPLTDGVVIRADYIGSIEAASGHLGRTATHEVGHWLNLRHIWGDANCGDDLVADTPVHKDANQSNCPKYPYLRRCDTTSALNNVPYGEMYMNYMDYTEDYCQNMFSKGQSLRMDATLAGTRAQLITQANLVATGTNDGAVQGAGIARPYICEADIVTCAGSSASFTATIYNGIPDSYLWTFPGGTPSTSSSANPTIQYNTPGTYDVLLKTTNSVGSDSTKQKGHITITSSNTTPAATFSDSFENGLNAGWSISNADNDVVTWSLVSTAAYSGTQSIKINNYNGTTATQGKSDYLISPAFDFTGYTTPKLTFYASYAWKTATKPTDALRISTSVDCGKTWSLKASITATTLQSAGVQNTNLTPKTQSQWKMQTLTLPSLANVPSALIRFEFKAGTGGNNLYLDDINLLGVVGINELTPSAINLSIVPNPTDKFSILSFELQKQQQVSIKVYDLLGREVESLVNEKLSEGLHSFEINKLENKGIYFVKIMIDNDLLTQKLILN